MTYDLGNPGPGLGQAQKCGGVKAIDFFLLPNQVFVDSVSVVNTNVIYEANI